MDGLSSTSCPHPFDEGRSMSLPPVLRALLLNGPGKSPCHYHPLRCGGSAVVRAAWGRHRAELIAACKPGARPWAFWKIQLGIPKPAGRRRRAAPHQEARALSRRSGKGLCARAP